jgi:hypothetical protein
MSLRQRTCIGLVLAAAAAVIGALGGTAAGADERARPPSDGTRVLGSLHGMASSVTLYANGTRRPGLEAR